MRWLHLGFVMAGLALDHNAWAGPRVAPKRKPRPTGAIAAAGPHASTRSPCGRHLLVVRSGAVLLNGQRVHGPGDRFEVAGTPLWRADGQAVAWLERSAKGLRLVVIAHVEQSTAPLFWSLPRHAVGEHLAWAGPHRVVVGNDLLAPQAVATWTEDS